MAPAVPRTTRTTRSSTQTQTSASRNGAQTKAKSAKPTETGRIEKHPTKGAEKSKQAAKSTSAPKTSKVGAGAQPKASKAKKQEQAEPESSKSAPDNVTFLTIDHPLAKTPIVCHQYAPSGTSPHNHPLLIFTHGAGGDLSASAMVNFCTGFSSVSPSTLLAFQGSMNLGARAKGFLACHAHLKSHAGSPGGAEKVLAFGGRSMGARAAVIAATELVAAARGTTSVKARLVLVSYPLQGPKDVRDQILLDLPEGAEVLFVVGDRDAMCPLELLEPVRKKMKANSRVVVVRTADHGMNVKPTSKTKEMGEETGRLAAKWLDGEIKSVGDRVYLGEEK